MRKKGFTLIELIIVIAIIGILTGILIPSWGAYMRSARTRSQNVKAKAVFNAAQTVVTDMKFSERRYFNDMIDECSAVPFSQVNLNAAADWIYSNFETDDAGNVKKDGEHMGEFCFYWDGASGVRLDTDIADASATKARVINEWNAKLAESINKIVDDDELVYKVYVKDYKVQSVVSARSESDRYLGTYPLNLINLEDEGVDVNEIRDGKILATDMNMFTLDATFPDPESP